MFVVDGLSEQTDDDRDANNNSKQHDAEVQVVDVTDDARACILLTTRRRRVRTVPREPRYADHQPHHQTPERTLYSTQPPSHRSNSSHN